MLTLAHYAGGSVPHDEETPTFMRLRESGGRAVPRARTPASSGGAPVTWQRVVTNPEVFGKPDIARDIARGPTVKGDPGLYEDTARKAQPLVGDLPEPNWIALSSTGERRTDLRHIQIGKDRFQWFLPGDIPVGPTHFGKPRQAHSLVTRVFGGPGALGFFAGLVLPGLLPVWATATTGIGVAVGGYYAPEGSWFRRFSVGMGIGAGTYTGIHAIAPTVRAVGSILQAAGVLSAYPWTHWIPVVGPFLETLFPTP